MDRAGVREMSLDFLVSVAKSEPMFFHGGEEFRSDGEAGVGADDGVYIAEWTHCSLADAVYFVDPINNIRGAKGAEATEAAADFAAQDLVAVADGGFVGGDVVRFVHETVLRTLMRMGEL